MPGVGRQPHAWSRARSLAASLVSAHHIRASTNAEDARVLRFAFVETLLGGTGKFSRIRGTLRGTGERVVGATVGTAQINGEVWFDE